MKRAILEIDPIQLTEILKLPQNVSFYQHHYFTHNFSSGYFQFIVKGEGLPDKCVCSTTSTEPLERVHLNLVTKTIVIPDKTILE